MTPKLELMAALDSLHRHFLCPICGSPMIHYRLRGYKCANEEHNERAAALAARAVEARRREQG